MNEFVINACGVRACMYLYAMVQDIWVWNGRPHWDDVFKDMQEQRQHSGDLSACLLVSLSVCMFASLSFFSISFLALSRSLYYRELC